MSWEDPILPKGNFPTLNTIHKNFYRLTTKGTTIEAIKGNNDAHYLPIDRNCVYLSFVW